MFERSSSRSTSARVSGGEPSRDTQVGTAAARVALKPRAMTANRQTSKQIFLPTVCAEERIPNMWISSWWTAPSLHGRTDKWGYWFGDLTTDRLHAVYPITGQGRVGVRAEGFRTEPDTSYANTVSERGAPFLYLGPTFSWNPASTLNAGRFFLR